MKTAGSPSRAIKCFSDTMQVSAPAAIVAALMLTLTGPASADTSSSANATEYRWEVDMRGKPPYKRERVPVNVPVNVVDIATVDIASMEVIDADVTADVTTGLETEVVWQREFTGRPPFSRKRVELPVVDAALMELVDEPSTDTKFRSRPKRHR